jgi:E3 ubiquitin-protein ligase TRIP12
VLTACLLKYRQKVALKIVAEIVEECDEADVPKAMEAAPALCNLLQSSDNTVHVFLVIIVMGSACLVLFSSICVTNVRYKSRPFLACV